MIILTLPQLIKYSTLLITIFTLNNQHIPPIQLNNIFYPLIILTSITQYMQASSIQLMAKKTHYGVDGTGRDSYVNFDNGGNYRGYHQQGIGKFERGGYEAIEPRKVRISSTYVPIEGRPLHYTGNGSGRDTYIISSEGGIAKGYKNHNFLQSLRAPIARKEVKKEDIYSRTQQNWKGKLPQKYGNYQRNLDRRMSEHKTYEDPYSQMRTTFRSSMRKGLC